MRATRRSTNTALPLGYYKELLKLLIAGLVAGATHAAIADSLNAHGLHTHVGLEWNRDSVKTALRNVRNPHQYPASINKALTELIEHNHLTNEEVKPLFVVRM